MTDLPGGSSAGGGTSLGSVSGITGSGTPLPPTDLRRGSSAGGETSHGSVSGMRDQFCSPSTGVKSCRLLQQLLKICRPAASNWSAGDRQDAVPVRG